jgi:hypothetical protein
MSVSRKPLVELFNEIREAIIEKLKEHESLEEIKDVVYGERQRIGTLQSPAIWIVPEPYQPELRGGRTAQHDFTFDFVVLVKGTQPQESLKEAERLSMTIYDVFTEDRTLDGLVSDVRPMQVDPAYEAGSNTQLYWSAVQFVFRLQRRE